MVLWYSPQNLYYYESYNVNNVSNHLDLGLDRLLLKKVQSFF